jgi:hypothetical protein
VAVGERAYQGPDITKRRRAGALQRKTSDDSKESSLVLFNGPGLLSQARLTIHHHDGVEELLSSYKPDKAKLRSPYPVPERQHPAERSTIGQSGLNGTHHQLL